MSDKIEIRLYESGDETEIVPLLELGFNGWPKFDLPCSALDHWKWKYLDNPCGNLWIALALDSDAIVGCVHGGNRMLKVGNRIILSSQAMDGVVHPCYRGKGIYNKIHEAMNQKRCKDGVLLGTGISGSPIIIERALRRGAPRFPQPVLSLSWIQDIDLHIKEKDLDISWIYRIGYKSVQYLQTFGKQDSLFDEIKCEKISHFDSKFDVFWNELKKYYDFIIARKLSYLRWRYSDVRGGNYVIYKAEHKGILCGYIILRINYYESEYAEGYIVDLVTLSDGKQTRQALLREAIDFFEENGVNVVHVLAIKGTPEERILKRFGFVNVKTDNHVFITAINPDAKGFVELIERAKPEKLMYQYGDADSI